MHFLRTRLPDSIVGLPLGILHLCCVDRLADSDRGRRVAASIRRTIHRLSAKSEKNRPLFLLTGRIHPPTQETTALAVEECVTVDANSVSDRSNRLRRISLTGG